MYDFGDPSMGYVPDVNTSHRAAIKSHAMTHDVLPQQNTERVIQTYPVPQRFVAAASAMSQVHMVSGQTRPAPFQ